jgi:hypothetical protein
MQRAAVKHLIDILANLLRAQNDLLIKLTAAEKLLNEADATLFARYKEESARLLRAVDFGSISLTLQGLQEKLLRE